MVDSCVEFKGMIGITQLSVLVKTEWWSPEYAGPRAISFLIAQIPLNVPCYASRGESTVLTDIAEHPSRTNLNIGKLSRDWELEVI